MCPAYRVHSKVGRLKLKCPIDHKLTAQPHQLHGASPCGRQRSVHARISAVGAPLSGQHLPLQLLLPKLLCHQRGLLRGVCVRASLCTGGRGDR